MPASNTETTTKPPAATSAEDNAVANTSSGTPTLTVLLTGASGVVGRALATELARDHHVIGLAHTDVVVPEAAEVLVGDLQQPRFGLPEAAWHDLIDRTDVVIHSGALTQWGHPRARYQPINIEGTRRVVEFARRADAPVHYVGTCFVHAIERGLFDTLRPQNVVAPYIWSKLSAERVLVRSGVPYVIYRPTNLVGDSHTGASSRPQIVQLMADWFCRGKAPYFPAHPGNRVDIVPLDFTARAVAGVLRSGDLGATVWITHGGDAMTVEEAHDILLTHARDIGREIEPVSIVDPRRPLPVPLDQVPATSRAFLQVLIDVSEVTYACGGVLPTSMPELRTRYAVPDVSDRDAFRLSLNYWSTQRAAGSTSQAGLH